MTAGRSTKETLTSPCGPPLLTSQRWLQILNEDCDKDGFGHLNFSGTGDARTNQSSGKVKGRKGWMAQVKAKGRARVKREERRSEKKKEVAKPSA